MQYRFAQLVDIPTIQELVNSLWAITGIPVGVDDEEGTLLVGAGWQDICTRFHRVHPESERRCKESTTSLRRQLTAENSLPDCGYVEYTCRNGMIEIAMPILIEGHWLATVILGQFFYAPPDEAFFKKQAQKYGFEENPYLEALRRVPFFTREKVEEVLALYSQLVSIVTRVGMDRLKQKEAQRASEYRGDFESLVCRISTRFIQLPPAEVPTGIDLALQELGRFLGVDRICLFLRVEGGEYTRCINEWCAEGVTSVLEQRQNLRVSDFSWHGEQLLVRKSVCISRVADLPSEAQAEKAFFEKYGIRSVLGVPIYVAGDQVGLLAYHSVLSEKSWDDEDLPFFPTIAEIFGNAIARQRSDTALRASEERFKKLSGEFRGVLDGIPDIILLLSPEMKVVWGNQAAADYRRLGASQIPGGICYETWHRRDAPCPGCPVLKAFASGNVEEHRLKRRDGTTWILKAIPLKDQEGRVVNVIEIVSDVSERVRLREDSERNGRLAALGELSAGVAHEINNPNALVLLNSSILKRAFPDLMRVLDDYYRDHGEFTLGRLSYSELREELPELIEGIEGGAQRIKRIVEDLKNFVRPLSQGHKEVIDLNEVVEAAVSLVGDLIKNSTDRFGVRLEENLPKVMAYSQGVEQVVVNLIVNACQALTERQKGVFVTTRIGAGRRSVVLEVRDEGAGIPPEHLPHVTEPFYTTRRNMGGSGLGLSVSARIVRDLKGTLDFESSRGAGTTVTLEIPVFTEIDKV